jgi:hypothetical protein
MVGEMIVRPKNVPALVLCCVTQSLRETSALGSDLEFGMTKHCKMDLKEILSAGGQSDL